MLIKFMPQLKVKTPKSLLPWKLHVYSCVLALMEWCSAIYLFLSQSLRKLTPGP